MIEDKIKEYKLNSINRREVKIKNSEHNKESAQVVDTIIKYLAEDGFVLNHPDKNYSKCAFISPCMYSFVSGEPDRDNRDYIDYFEHTVYDQDVYRLRILYEQGGEDIYFIPNISLGEAMTLAANYNQYTFIYRDVNGCREICSKPFMDKEGNSYEISDVVREINTYDSHLESEKELSRILVEKQKTCEVDGWEKDNTYEQKNEYEFYYISRPRPRDRFVRYAPLYRTKFLVYFENRSENR